LILALLFCLSTSIFPQIGISGGLNLSSLRSGIEPDHNEYKVGFHIGGFYDIHLVDKLYLHPQLLFSYDPSNQTYKTVLDGEHIITKLKTEGYYISVPVMFSYRFPINKKSNIGVDLGAYITLGLFGNYNAYSNTANPVDNYSTPLFPDYRSRDEEGLIGGVRYELNNYVLAAHVKYGLSTINLENDKVILFMLSVGYKFNK
jgi:hypothetical protein